MRWFTLAGLIVLMWSWSPVLPVRLSLRLCDSNSELKGEAHNANSFSCENWTLYLDEHEFLYVFDKESGLLEDHKLNRSFHLDFKNRVKWPFRPPSSNDLALSQQVPPKLVEVTPPDNMCSTVNPEMGECRVHLISSEGNNPVRVYTRRTRWPERILLKYQDHQDSPLLQAVVENLDRDVVIFRIEVLDQESKIVSTTEIAQLDPNWWGIVGLGGVFSQKSLDHRDISERFADRPTVPMQEIRELQRMTQKDREAFLKSQGGSNFRSFKRCSLGSSV